MTVSRRDFLIASATAGASHLDAQPRVGARAIDLHHHFVSPAYVKALAAKEGHHMAWLHFLVSAGSAQGLHGRQGH